eukprot:TRINITY_DN3562_c0_g1_i1.p1 TRINITY_DN3562_c0_g1~~TRINITY_DN3562_c0_g1_i1.p1  ORF type:complete len:348 (-),score=72.01 TRINITY_DN3562_c0_g1_i1:375-1418(-)
MGSEMDSSLMDLYGAVKSDDVSAIRKLIAGGCRIQSCADSFNRNALHWATVLGHEESLKALLLNTSRRLIDVKDRNGRTALHYACSAGRPQFASLLIKRGACVNSKDSKGRTPLHYAAQNKNPEVVDTLLKNGADKTVKDGDGVKPWDLALKWGCSDCLEALRIEHGVLCSKEETENGVTGSDRVDGVENPRVRESSVESLLAEWKKAEAEKKEPKDAVIEALRAWRAAEAEARKERRKRSLTDQTSSRSSRSSSSSCSSCRPPVDVKMLRLVSGPNLLCFCRNLGGEMVNKMDDSWGCTEWDSPLKPQEGWDRLERRPASNLSTEALKDPWMKRKSLSPASPIEAV